MLIVRPVESDAQRRCRNVIAAIENLLTQLDAHGSMNPAAVRLRDMLDLYRLEMEFHRGR